MSRIFFFLAEAFRALRRSAAPSLAAIVTVVLTTLLIGVFVPVIKASSTTNENVRAQLALRVFLAPDATKKQGKAVQHKIARIPHVAHTKYISKTQGLKVLRSEVGSGPLRNGLGQLKGNPLPDSINVFPDDPDNLNSIQSAITPPGAKGKQKPISPAIESVNNGQGQANTIRTVTNAVKIILTVIAVLLLVASLMLVANTIRLSIYARRREVEVMRLVGATNWFIRWPFVIEGIIVGALGAVLALAVLGVTKVALLDPLANHWTLLASPRTISFTALVAVLIGAGVIVSAVGSGLSLRRFLRV